MNDPLLMRVLNRVANLREELQPPFGREIVLIAVVRDFGAAHQFHDEVRPARVRRTSVEDPGDVRMIHKRQRLSFRLKARDDRVRVHAELDDLERDPTTHRFLLFGHVNDTATAFTDLLQQFVTANPVSRLLSDGHG